MKKHDDIVQQGIALTVKGNCLRFGEDQHDRTTRLYYLYSWVRRLEADKFYARSIEAYDVIRNCKVKVRNVANEIAMRTQTIAEVSEQAHNLNLDLDEVVASLASKSNEFAIETARHSNIKQEREAAEADVAQLVVCYLKSKRFDEGFDPNGNVALLAGSIFGPKLTTI